MKHINKIILVAISLCGVIYVNAQKAKELYDLCRPLPLNASFNSTSTSLLPDDDKYSLPSGSYLLPNIGKTLYGLPILKMLLVAYDDTARAVNIFLPFDSTLHKRMEKDLGPSVGAWMALEPGVDTTGMILDMRWFLDDYIIVFSCTRHINLRGENGKDDRIRITVSRRRKAITNN